MSVYFVTWAGDYRIDSSPNHGDPECNDEVFEYPKFIASRAPLGRDNNRGRLAVG